MYSVQATSTVNGCSAKSANVTATVNQSPTGDISYSSPVAFCQGSAVVLSTYTSANLSYQWRKNGVNIPGATTPTLYADSTGLYNVYVANSATGCFRNGNAVQVTVFPRPDVVVSYNVATNTLVTTQPFAQYQWQLNNLPIPNAVQRTFTPTQSGAYSVNVVDTNGCNNVSNIKFVNNVGVTTTTLGASIKIFPNPTTGILRVTASEKVMLVLQDITGKAVIKGDSDQPLDLKNLADGLYLLNVTDKEGRLVRAEKVTKSGN